MLFDTHTHYDDSRFDTDREETITRAHAQGIGLMLNAASDLVSARQSMELAHRFDFLYAAVGIHPHHVENLNEETMTLLEQLAADERVVAIGEIGLDYYYDTAPREIQRHWFARQVCLARKLRLPVIVHNRDAHEDTMRILREEAPGVSGVLHCFTGSVEMARELVKMGFYLSFGGAVTFKKARKALEVVREIPMDRLLIETDCPYMTPEPFRGKRNDSGYVRLVAEKIAEIRDMPFEEVAAITTDNARRLFSTI